MLDETVVVDQKNATHYLKIINTKAQALTAHKNC